MIARAALTVLIALFPVVALAAEPVIRVSLEQDSAVPGQPVTLRLTVLVPTWMPQPPVLPSFDIPNLMVRLPERATGPISERVDGDTWSGLSRRYRLYPLVPGTVAIPPQPVEVTFADTATRQPRSVSLTTPALSLTGVVPEGATGLSPFIAAHSLILEQTVEGDPTAMVPGDAVTRRLRLALQGAPAMTVPTLLAPAAAQRGLAAYPKTPVTQEREGADGLSSERVEEITYVAEAGGRFALPAVGIRWFNLKTGEIETVEAEGLNLVARGAPPAPVSPPRNWRDRLLVILPALVLLAIVSVFGQRIAARAAGLFRLVRARYEASEAHAFRLVISGVAGRRLGATATAIRQWQAHPRLRHAAGAAAARQGVSAAMAEVGRLRFGTQGQGSEQAAWRRLETALRRLRRHLLASGGGNPGGALPPLNPTTRHGAPDR